MDTVSMEIVMMISRSVHHKMALSALSMMAAISVAALSGCAGAQDPDSGANPRRCGARLGDTCRAGEYCDFPDDLCGAADAPGVCKERPQACTREFNPTCGCDGKIHSNPCMTRADGTDVSRLGCQ
jgi:hypothetical protein